MKIIVDYLKQRLAFIVFYLIFTAVYLGIFFLYFIELESIFYAFGICSVFLLTAGIIDFTKYYRKRKQLQMIKEQIQYSLIIPNIATSSIEKEYEEIIAILIHQINKLIQEEQIATQEMMDYYTLWAHQVKLPISAMDLLLQKDDGPLSFKMSTQLLRMQQYVDMVLSYLRIQSESSDYVLKEVQLDGVIRQAIRSLSILFIEKNLKMNFAETNKYVLSDEKWLGYVIEQLLSNAIKYTNAGSISIYIDEELLVIEDTGIGIEAEDLERIFDKGYTGINGRKNQESSGLGLYLCRTILKNLSHGFRIESKVGKGTKVFIDFSHIATRIE